MLLKVLQILAMNENLKHYPFSFSGSVSTFLDNYSAQTSNLLLGNHKFKKITKIILKFITHHELVS